MQNRDEIYQKDYKRQERRDDRYKNRTRGFRYVKFKTISDEIEAPKYATDRAAGCDLCAYLKEDVVLKPGERTLVPTGLSIELFKWSQAEIRPRSGLAVKHGVTVLNSPGTIDSDYRGEIKVILINHGKEDFVIKNKERIAQMVIMPYSKVEFLKVEDLNSTDRGSGGFGSTGK